MPLLCFIDNVISYLMRSHSPLLDSPPLLKKMKEKKEKKKEERDEKKHINLCEFKCSNTLCSLYEFLGFGYRIHYSNGLIWTNFSIETMFWKSSRHIKGNFWI